MYGSPRFRERSLLWNNLKILSVRHNLPWAVMGDFNDVTREEEKSGGNGINSRRVFAYNECMDYCNLIDLGFSGPKFTWSNCRDVSDLIQQRLDRVWVNSDWKLLYPDASVSHLARISSDHCPLLLSLQSNLGHRGLRPFRFQPIWLSHDGFPDIVREAWVEHSQDICSAVANFTQKAKNWNKEVFGDIFWRKRKLTARILGAEKALANNPSQRLIDLHKLLSGELEKILDLEEELWGMKARINWLIQGERNTNFFHVTALTRRSRNRIAGINDPNGNWIVDIDRVKEIFLMGFKKLYSSEQV